jgi:hypothetical protein
MVSIYSSNCNEEHVSDNKEASDETAKATLAVEAILDEWDDGGVHEDNLCKDNW